jgi:hypothetical protein
MGWPNFERLDGPKMKSENNDRKRKQGRGERSRIENIPHLTSETKIAADETMMSNNHRIKSLALIAPVLLIDAVGSFIAPSGIATPSRHTSLVSPLNYLNSEDEQDQTNEVPTRPKKTRRRSFVHHLDRLLTDLQMTQSHLRHHHFLSGNYAPVDKEHFQVEVEVVEGEIPKGIWGAFLRNGPNPRREWMKKRYHWFDGRKYF